MNFISGNYYTTRDGRKALCVGCPRNSSSSSRLIFKIFKDDEDFSGELWLYYFNGRYGMEECDCDIISEWEDNPKKIERIVNIYYSPEKIPNVEIFSQFASKINDIIDAVNKLQEK